jgi:hypothetical protein
MGLTTVQLERLVSEFSRPSVWQCCRCAEITYDGTLDTPIHDSLKFCCEYRHTKCKRCRTQLARWKMGIIMDDNGMIL